MFEVFEKETPPSKNSLFSKALSNDWSTRYAIGKAYGFDVEPVKKLIPPEEHPDSLNPAKIGTELGGVSANKVNKLLEKLGFQSKIGGDWKLTDSGKQYGSAVPYTNNYNGHSGYRVMWSEKVIPFLRDMKG